MNQRDPDERELVDAFDRLRADDRRRTPDAADVLARARRDAEILARRPDLAPATAGTRGTRTPVFGGRPRRRWAVPGLGVAMAAAVAAILLIDAGDDGADFDRVVEAWNETGGAWRAPTDGLLRMPGDEMLRGLPSIGGLPTSSPSALDVPVLDDPGRENPS